MSTIIIYSGGSNTTAVSEYIAKKTSGKAVKVSQAGSEDLSAYDTIVIGGRVHAGKLPKDLVNFVAEKKDVISSKNSAFFVCCMYNDDKGQSQCDGLANNLGISKHTFFNKGKKIVQEENNPVDDFIATF